VNRETPGESYGATLDEINPPRRIWAVCGALALMDALAGVEQARVVLAQVIQRMEAKRPA